MKKRFRKIEFKNLKFFLFLGSFVFILLALMVVKGLKTKPVSVSETKVATQSGFSSVIKEIKKSEDAQRAQDKKKIDDATRIANYGPCRYVPILMYHHVGPWQNWLFVTKEMFASHLDYLAQKGYTTVTLSEVMSSLQGQGSLPAKPIVLTFDDGYRDFYNNAFPLLQAHNFKATLFVITQFVGGDVYVTWDELAQMKSSGLITIGDHTLSHRSLPALDFSQTRDQVLSAKNILEEHLGGEVNVFAYPYGGVSNNAENVLKEGGFAAAVTTQRGLACAKLPYELPRIRIGNSPLSSFGL